MYTYRVFILTFRTIFSNLLQEINVTERSYKLKFIYVDWTMFDDNEHFENIEYEANVALFFIFLVKLYTFFSSNWKWYFYSQSNLVYDTGSNNTCLFRSVYFWTVYIRTNTTRWKHFSLYPWSNKINED